MRLIDTHCHLTHARLSGDLAGLADRAAAAGVVACICASGGLEESARSQAMAQRGLAGASGGAAIPVFFTAGIHPHEAKDAPADYIRRLEVLLGSRRSVAVGEIGLDYHYDFSPRDVQRKVFAEQLHLARRLGENVVIHTRQAFEDTLAILREGGVDGSRVVFHSFTEDASHARAALDIGAMIGLSGIATFKKADGLRRSAAIVPANRLLIETDGPYLSPEPVRGMRNNEPANVAHVVSCLAVVRRTTPDALAELTTANAIRFFGLDIGG